MNVWVCAVRLMWTCGNVSSPMATDQKERRYERDERLNECTGKWFQNQLISQEVRNERLRGERQGMCKTFAAKLVVSSKDRTWITGDRRATGPSNIHAFAALSGLFLTCLENKLRQKAGIPCKD